MKEIRLPFVDQLKSVANRINLTMQGCDGNTDDNVDVDDLVSGEAGLAQILLDDGRIQLSHYGHLVAYGLNKVRLDDDNDDDDENDDDDDDENDDSVTGENKLGDLQLGRSLLEDERRCL